jgi:hypothetical protein
MKQYGDFGCTATLQSLTAAQRAQRALSAAAIRSSIIKTEGTSFTHGCSYGIEFPCNQQRNVAQVLEGAGVAVKRWNTRD